MGVASEARWVSSLITRLTDHGALLSLLMNAIVFCLPVIGITACQSVSSQAALTMEDRIAISQLLSRYAQYIDARQGEAYAATFTSDGELIFPGVKLKGHDALAAFAARSDPNRFDLHFVGDILLVPIAPGEVYARSKVILGHQGANGQPARLDAFGTYEDNIRKTPEGWKFARRRADRDLPMAPEFLVHEAGR